MSEKQHHRSGIDNLKHQLRNSNDTLQTAYAYEAALADVARENMVAEELAAGKSRDNAESSAAARQEIIKEAGLHYTDAIILGGVSSKPEEGFIPPEEKTAEITKEEALAARSGVRAALTPFENKRLTELGVAEIMLGHEKKKHETLAGR